MSRKKDSFGAENLKKSDLCYKSMNSMPVAYVLTNLKLILNISAGKK
jgi:hypothetical protein